MDKSYSVKDGKLVLGRTLMTRAVHDHYHEAGVQALERFSQQDFGEVDPEDAEVNRQALADDSRLMGVYPLDGVTIWVIREAVSPTGEWDTVTTVLLPSDY